MSTSKHSQSYVESVTLTGLKYHENDECWVVRGSKANYYFDFNIYKSTVTNKFLNGFKQYISSILLLYPENTANTYFSKCKTVINFLLKTRYKNSKLNEISVADMLHCLSLLNCSSSQKIGIRTAIIKWSFLKIFGVENDMARELLTKKIKKRFNRKNLLTADPIYGAYTSQEFISILNATDHAYRNGKMSLKTYLISCIYHSFGVRTTQIAQLKVKDFLSSYNKNNTITYSLQIPLAKQRNENERSDFLPLPVIPELACIVEQWLIELKNEYIINVKSSLQHKNFSELHMFPNWERNEYDYRPYDWEITNEYKKLNSILNVYSERTGSKINISPYRARYTMATRAAIEGKTIHVIARLLGHTSIRSAQVYYDFVRNIAVQIDDLIKDDIVDIVRYFKGEIISNKPIKGTKVINRVRSDNPHNADVGFCVEPSGCAIYSDNLEPLTILSRIPYCCYTCPFFKAWNDIEVHMEHLKILENEKLKMWTGYDSDSKKMQISMSDSLDLTTSAIREVINFTHSTKQIS